MSPVSALRPALVALTFAWVAALLLLPARTSAWSVFALSLPWLAAVSWAAATRAGVPWMAYLRATADWHAVGAALLYGVAVLIEDTHGITSDGAIYFAHLRSLLFDGDLEIAREFEILGQPARPHNFVPIGPSILWAPLYAFVAAIDTIARTLQFVPAPADAAGIGLDLHYVRSALLSSYAVAAAGLVAVHWRLRQEFERSVALAATLLLFGATTLFWYMVYEPAMTHAASFGLVALFVVLSARWVPPGATPRQALVLGTLIGLAFLTRPQEAVFAIFPAILIFSRRDPAAVRVRAAARLAGWAFAGALPWLLLQAWQGFALYSRYQFRVAGEGGYLRLTDPRFVDVLFSSWHGLFTWTPVVYIAVIGVIAYWRRNAVWAATALLMLAVMAWINGSTEDWAGGWAFGGRRFTSVLALLAPGLAVAVDLLRRRPLLAIVPLVAIAIQWNHLLMVQYTTGVLPKDAPVSFARMVRQQAEIQTRSPFFYPFAFPVNAWFAWRERLPIDRYDLLHAEPRRDSIDLRFDRRVDKFLLDGWDAPGADDWGSVWWIGGREATLALPLAPPVNRDVAITVTTRARFEEPAVEANLALAINGREVGRFTSAPRAPGDATFTVPAAAVGQVFRAGYNRLTFVSHGVQRVDPSDTRPPGALGSRPGNPAWPVALYRIRIEPR